MAEVPAIVAPTEPAAAATLSYAIITPVRDEARNLRRLAASLETQTVRPAAWVIVDTGSTDGTLELSRLLADDDAWVYVAAAPGASRPTRGGPVVRALYAGFAALEDEPDVVVKVDADVSLDPDYFERLLAAFAADPLLGIASGSRYEWIRGEWRRDAAPATTVEAQARAYRWRCLADVLPLEERMGWDVIDETRALLAGWTTRTLSDVAFRHHRPMGARDASRREAWAAQGDVAHYTGYRPSYVLLRALYRMSRDPAALMIVWGYLCSVVTRRPRYPDAAVRDYRRRQQRLRHLPQRLMEAFGWTRRGATAA